jgi:hypothetical protein
VEEGGPGHEGGLVGAEVDGKGGGQGKFGGVAAATHPASVPAGLNLAEDLPAAVSVDRPLAPTDRSRSVYTEQPASATIPSDPTREALGPDNSFAGQSAGTISGDSPMGEEHHRRLSGLGKQLRQLFAEWCVEYEAWACLSHFGDPRRVDKQLDSSALPQSRGWGRDRVSLLRSFFEALSSNSIHTWCNSLFRRKMCLLGFLGDELFGPLNKLSQRTSSRGRAPPSLRLLSVASGQPTDRRTQTLPPHSPQWGAWERLRDGDSSRILQVSPLFWGIFSQLWTVRAFSISRRTHNLSCFGT